MAGAQIVLGRIRGTAARYAVGGALERRDGAQARVRAGHRYHPMTDLIGEGGGVTVTAVVEDQDLGHGPLI